MSKRRGTRLVRSVVGQRPKVRYANPSTFRISAEPTLAVTVGLLSNLVSSGMVAIVMKPFLPVGEVPRRKKLPLVAGSPSASKVAESRVRRQVNETVKIGQGVRLDARHGSAFVGAASQNVAPNRTRPPGFVRRCNTCNACV